MLIHIISGPILNIHPQLAISQGTTFSTYSEISLKNENIVPCEIANWWGMFKIGSDNITRIQKILQWVCRGHRNALPSFIPRLDNLAAKCT